MLQECSKKVQRRARLNKNLKTYFLKVSGPCRQLSGSAGPPLLPATTCLCKHSLNSIWGQILDDVKNRHVVGLKIFLGVEVTAESSLVLHSCSGRSCVALLMSLCTGAFQNLIPVWRTFQMKTDFF